MKTNREIRAQKVRVISNTGEQLGVLPIQQAMTLAKQADMDLVEIVSTSTPPVCKIMDYGKFRYDQTKRERESRKSQHQIKVKEVKLSPNISDHDFDFKMRQAKSFLEKGNKVKISCFFRGREITHPEVGKRLMDRVLELLGSVCMVETSPNLFGKMLSMVLAPISRKK